MGYSDAGDECDAAQGLSVDGLQQKWQRTAVSAAAAFQLLPSVTAVLIVADTTIRDRCLDVFKISTRTF